MFTGIVSILISIGIVYMFPGFLEAAVNVMKGALVLIMFFMGLLLFILGLDSKHSSFQPPQVEIPEKAIR